MKVIIFRLSFILFLFISCSKGNSGSSSGKYFVKATVDGTDVNYSNYTAAVQQRLGYLQIYGYKSSDLNAADGITFIISNEPDGGNQAIIPGTYTDTANTHYSETVRYLNPFAASAGFRQAGMGYRTLSAVDTLSAAPFTVNITAIDVVSVSGNFYGTVYFGVDSTSVSKKITNGSFVVPF